MIRFFNGKVLTLDGNSLITDSEVWTDKDKISFVGKPDAVQLEKADFEREYDLKGNLLMPSFKNAHTHSAMTFLRSYADDLPLQDWLFKQVFPMEAKLDGEKVYWLTKLAILEYLSTGCTAVFDMYFELDDYVKACVESGFRTVLCGSVSGDESACERLEENYNKFNGKNDLVSFMLGFHAEYTCEKALLEKVGKLAKKYKAPVATHNSETAKEVCECIEKYGCTPTQLFDSLGIYDYGGAGFHCVYLDDNDIEIFRDKNVWAVSCPASNLKLASGIAPVEKLRCQGINIALGTDGPASNNCLDMFREMFLLTALQKVKENDASACPAEFALVSATVGGARAMGLTDCDTIAVGKKADLVVINLDRPNMQPMNNIVKNIVYSGSKENVKLTVCNGKILYEDGEFNIGENAQTIYRKANEIINSMKE